MQIIEGEAGVQNVFHQDHISIFHGLVHIFGQPHFAGRIPPELQFLRRAGTVAVAGDSDEVESRVELDLACQIAQKNGRALEHAHKNYGLPGKIASDLSAHRGHAMRRSVRAR